MQPICAGGQCIANGTDLEFGLLAAVRVPMSASPDSATATPDRTAPVASVIGSYSFAPGAAFDANANNSPWWTRYKWTPASDANGDGVWQPGEEDPSPLNSRGGITPDAIDPRLKLPRLNELGAWFERELPGNMALRTGIVWRGERDHFLRQDVARPFEAFSTPIAIPDPGPDGHPGTSDDGAALHGYQLGPEAPGQTLNLVRNVPRSDSHYWTWDIARLGMKFDW